MTTVFIPTVLVLSIGDIFGIVAFVFIAIVLAAGVVEEFIERVKFKRRIKHRHDTIKNRLRMVTQAEIDLALPNVKTWSKWSLTDEPGHQNYIEFSHIASKDELNPWDTLADSEKARWSLVDTRTN